MGGLFFFPFWENFKNGIFKVFLNFSLFRMYPKIFSSFGGPPLGGTVLEKIFFTVPGKAGKIGKAFFFVFLAIRKKNRPKKAKTDQKKNYFFWQRGAHRGQ